MYSKDKIYAEHAGAYVSTKKRCRALKIFIFSGIRRSSLPIISIFSVMYWQHFCAVS